MRRISIPESTRGGIILPLEAIELPQLAVVIHGGPKKNPGIEPGDVVLLSKYAGARWFPDPANSDEEYLLMHYDEILAVIEGVTHDNDYGKEKIKD